MISRNKHHFLLILNTTILLAQLYCFLTILAYSLIPFATSLQNNSIYPMVTLAQSIYRLSSIILGFVNILAITLIVLIWREIKARGLINYLQSLYDTLALRRFLKSSSDGNWNYNQAVSKSVVEIHKDGMQIAIKLPTAYADQAHLQQFETIIMNELTYRHPSYFFSAPVREKDILWIVGTKR